MENHELSKGKIERIKDRGEDTGPLQDCLTSSRIQPWARATNECLSALLSIFPNLTYRTIIFRMHTTCTVMDSCTLQCFEPYKQTHVKTHVHNYAHRHSQLSCHVQPDKVFMQSLKKKKKKETAEFILSFGVSNMPSS